MEKNHCFIFEIVILLLLTVVGCSVQSAKSVINLDDVAYITVSCSPVVQKKMEKTPSDIERFITIVNEIDDRQTVHIKSVEELNLSSSIEFLDIDIEYENKMLVMVTVWIFSDKTGAIMVVHHSNDSQVVEALFTFNSYEIIQSAREIIKTING